MKTTALIALFLFAAGCKNPEAQPPPVEPATPPAAPSVAAPVAPPPPAVAAPVAPVNATADASVAAPPALDASAATGG